jgi:hypothetical protein
MALNRHFRRRFVLVCAGNSAISGGGYHQARMILSSPVHPRVTVGLAEGGVPEGWLEGVVVLLRLGATDGVAVGCAPLWDGGAVTAEGDPTGREGTLLAGDGEGLGVAKDDGARLGSGWAGV